MALLRRAPDGALEVMEVSPKLNNPRNEGPEVQEIIERKLL
jgi:putative SOS response-associated peptidase YedK